MTIHIAPARLDVASEVARIETYLRAHGGSTPFHRPAWVNAITNASGHRGHYLVAADGNDQIRGVLPLHDVRSRLFGHALVSSGFAVGGGVLTDDDATGSALAEAGWILAAQLGAPSLELRGGLLPNGPEWHVERETYAGFVRPLAADDEAMLTAIPRKQRAEVRRALGLGMEVRIGCGTLDREQHYRVYSESVRNLGTPVFPRRLFGAVLEAFGDEADILTILHQGQAVASVLSLYHDGVVMPYWGGGTKEARGLRANDLMYFALMRHARKRGCDRFDFGRSKAGTGAFAFKKNWGFTPESLPYAVRTADGSAPRAINPLDPQYKLKIAVWQRLPLSVANRIGPLIARGLG
jgi:FemAB-related protein (PEP-CTERM system-associated)